MAKNKADKISELCQQKGIEHILWPAGTFEGRKSQVWEFRKGRQRLATFTSPDRCIEWLEGL